ncbi:MAG: DNA helicase II [Gammaproteobacteria bacterium]|nr:DNA helicase II [Gammaproteobacteria bacterium]
MDVSNLLDDLNDAQRDAVAAKPGHLLVLAGAGSGKTRVLVHRMAWLIRVEEASPYSILAVTFTNKAAAEMRGRIEQMLGISTGGLWVGTFHGLAHRLLRAHWREAGLPQAFQILDGDDQYRLVRRILKALELDEARWPPKQAQGFINGRKDEGLRPHQIQGNGDPYTRQMVRIYQAYEEACQRGGMVDFAELLLRTLEMLGKHPEVLAHYRQRFRHILVDEFQDTNAIQYAWLKLLAGDSARLFIVGDDDQSIYGWRGARIENIQRVSQDFPGTRVIRLEQNYRSTGVILAAANALIANNEGRLGKNLWTAGEQGEPIQFYTAFNDLDEARFIVQRIERWVEQGNARREAAILYRSNAQSRVLEEALIAAGIPYRIYGGLRFFERAEIKDALAYLRLIANREDDASFERVVNTPARGVGERSLALVRDHARAHGLPLWQAARVAAVRPVAPFLDLIERLARDTAGLTLGEQIEHVIAHSGLRDHCRKEKGEKGEARVENLEELANAARQFQYDAESGLEPLQAFLAHAALEAGEGQGDAWQDCVQLMTLHSAKGLEFPLVFMCGVEEGLFPHQMSAQEPARLEEERRLCYVGITRARRHLFLTCAERRRLHGSEIYPQPSRFIGEIPPELLREVRPRASISRPLYASGRFAQPATAASQTVDDGIARPRLGQRVVHGKFGEGVVLNYEGQGEHARVQVNFKNAGSKWLVMAYANLQTV